MVVVRPVDWSRDTQALATLDTTIITDRTYEVERRPLAFTLVERSVTPPLAKTLCRMPEEIDAIRKMAHVVVAEMGGEVVGLAAAQLSAWNGRVVLWHLYVQPACRGCGAGTALMQSVVEYARSAGAWCVWLEAQNVNYPAVQFYQKCGFRLCGLDTNLYDPQGMGGGEVALFFAKETGSRDGWSGKAGGSPLAGAGSVDE